MNKYETVLIAKPEIEMTGLMSKYEDLIKANGELEQQENLGVKRLAYEVRGYKERLLLHNVF